MRRIGIFSIGQLGDTVIALPAIWALRSAFPDALFTLIYDTWPGRGLPSPRDILEGSDLIDDWIPYVPERGTRRALGGLRLLGAVRERAFDELAYLVPGERSSAQVIRDLAFFRLAGVRSFLAHRGFRSRLRADQVRGGPFQPVLREADHLLLRLRITGLDVPEMGAGKMKLPLTAVEIEWAREWISRQESCGSEGRGPLIAVAPGAKTDDQKWGGDRYAELGKALIKRGLGHPIVIGGPADRELAEWLRACWGQGWIAAGEATIRESAAILAHCELFVGNDSGPMHLAAAMGVRCIGLFSGREPPGKWDPYGEGHIVFRLGSVCRGCNREGCLHENACLSSVTVDQVIEACDMALGEAGGAR